METQNITLSVPKKVLRKFKEIAFRRQKSVSKLMVEMIEETVQKEEGYLVARNRHLRRLEMTTDLQTNGAVPGTGMIFMIDKTGLEFLDTNILVYAHDRSAGEKQATAKDLVRRLWETGNGCLSVQVLQEFYVTITRKVAQPMPMEDAAQILQDLSFWHVHSPDAGDVIGAIDIQRHYRVAFWDAMIIHSARQSGCQVIWSEDLTDGQAYDHLLIRNPFKRS